MSRKTLTFCLSVLSILGYGVIVFAVAPIGGVNTEFNPGQTLDPINCSPGDTYCKVHIAVGTGFTIDTAQNMFAGTDAGSSLGGGIDNFFAGIGSGAATTTGNYNTGTGFAYK